MTTMADRIASSPDADAHDDADEESFTLQGVVKWFDSTKGYGFIVPDEGAIDEGSPGDVLIHSSCLKAAGRDSAREGAKVACEVVRRSKGLQALKLLDIDESAAVAIAPQAAPVSQRPAGDFVRAQVKWFNRAKGYGFLTRGEGTEDIFVHMETVRASGLGELEPGQRLKVSFGEGGKGLLAVEIQADPEN